RAIFLIEHGYLPQFIDHRDGDRLNNRIDNLRACTNQENSWNSKKPSNNTSGIVGVTWNKNANRWKAQCNDHNGKRTYLGYFTNKHEAGEAVRKFCLEHHGEFAKQHWNPVDGDAISFLAAKLQKPLQTV